jgi:hypothetical protein
MGASAVGINMWQAPHILHVHDPFDQPTPMLRTMCHDAAEFGKVAAQGVEQGGALANQKLTQGPVQHQDTLLPGAVYRHKAQRWL